MVSTPIGFGDLKKGMRARVACLGAGEETHLRLQELGLTCGAEFRVVKVAPLNDPIEIEVRGYRLCLRRREAESFELELLDA